MSAPAARRPLATFPVSLLVTALLAVPPAAAAQTKLPDKVVVSGTALTLNGVGRRFVSGPNVKVYEAALYLPGKETDWKRVLVSTGPAQLRLFFLRDVAGQALRSSWETSFYQNSKNARRFEGEIRRLLTFLGDVKKNDEFVFTLVPHGAKVARTGGTSTFIEAPGFGGAFLAIWLGYTPQDETLKRGLLGAAE